MKQVEGMELETITLYPVLGGWVGWLCFEQRTTQKAKKVKPDLYKSSQTSTCQYKSS